MEVKNQTRITSSYKHTFSKCCIACKKSLSFLGKKSQYLYSTCNACKTVQLSPLPNKSELEKAYSDSLYASNVHGQGDPISIRKSSLPYYKCIADTLRDYKISKLVIDYGAGWGGLCSVLLENGFECKGIELAENMVEECKKLQLPVQQKSLESLREEGCKAEALVLCGVFEHLIDPRKFFHDAYHLLETDGLLISLQPTASFALLFAKISRFGQKKIPLSSMFWVFDAPWHVALYSIKGMKVIAEQCGFDLLEVRFAPQGRLSGLYGIFQRLLEFINKIGWKLFRDKWPLLISHTFVFKKST
jgi:hypothetical protein